MDKKNYNYMNNSNQFQNYNNYSNYSQNNQFNQKQEQNYQNPGFGRNMSGQQPNNNFQQESYSSFGNAPITVNNFRNTEAPNMNYKNQQFPPNQKEIPRMTENIKGKERPLWSYREIKYDEYKLPRNTECVTTHMLPRKSNVTDAQMNQKKKNLEELQQKDKKYFNNLKYQKRSRR